MKIGSYFFILLCCAFACRFVDKKQPSIDPEIATKAIRTLHEEYVSGWKEMNDVKIMSLIDEDAMIQPNSLTPIQSKAAIEKFWFPRNGSVTKIDSFVTKILSIQILDSLAVSTHTSFLSYTYTLDTIRINQSQYGINTTLYKMNKEHQWKIWRSMWTDYQVLPR